MEIKDLIFKTLAAWYRNDIGQRGEGLTLVGDDGTHYHFSHEQDCCESVNIDDIEGDLNDLIGSPILQAEENSSNENPTGVTKEYQESFTWTFYRFATAKGSVVIRWYGESNGYYSESVTLTISNPSKP